MPAAPSPLRPVAGTAAEISAALHSWLAASASAPLVVRTSGSTGAPKDVRLSAPAVRFSATASMDRLGGAGQWVLALPAHYVAGMQVLVRSVLAGMPAVSLDDHPGLAAATAALTARRTYLACVPTQLRRWLNDPASRAALARLDAVLVGGAAVDIGLEGEATAADVHIVWTYGMTETCGGCVYDGVPLDGVAVVVAANGHIRLSGPMLFDGYDGRPDLTAEVLRDGWLLTPDLGRFDADGRLVVTGRVDDVVKSGGVSVSLPAVESRLAAMPGIDEVAVVAAPDAEWGARVVAVAVTSQQVDLTAVRNFVSDVHPRTWAPQELRIVDRLPRLASGKVNREQVSRSLQSAP